MEAAGVALALCPIMLNQLDNYVQGLQTLKSFRTRYYREHLESCAAMLGSQYAILANTMGRALGDALPPDDIRKLFSAPDRTPDPRLEHLLWYTLGDNYDVFKAMMGQASKILEELADRLNWKASEPTVLPWNDPSAILREARKIKHICSKSIYNDLFHRLDDANSALKTLVEQSVEYSSRSRSPASVRLLTKHRMTRTAADSVHKALIRGKCWVCVCRDKHHIRFILDPQADSNHRPENLAFRIVVTTAGTEASSRMSFNWQEVEIESSRCEKGPQQMQTVNRNDKEKQSTAFSSQQRLCAESDHGIPSGPLTDMCSALSGRDSSEGPREMVGYVSEATYRHNLYLTRKGIGEPPSQTLEEVIMLSPSFPWDARSVGRSVFSRSSRLYLAAKLACSVFNFHGSWLQARWSSADIRLPGGALGFQEPFLIWGLSLPQEEAMPRRSSSIVRNESLFPLGLALIELSLCRSMKALRIPEDGNSDVEVTFLKTALRCLDHVYSESGTSYGDVVQRCLYWSRTRNTHFDSEEYQAAVFDDIVLPLLDDMRDFNNQPRVGMC